MRKQLPAYSKILDKKKPSTLFHYTTPIGLLEISTSKKIWATDIRYLNDSKEFQHALDITNSIIEDFYKVNDNSKGSEILDYDFIEHLRIDLGKNWNPEVYVVSFSEEGDLLSQWRGYCPKGGFSLGFHFDFLSQIAKIHDSDLLPCVYDPKIKKQIIEELLALHNRKYVGDKDVTNQEHSNQVAHAITNEFIISLFAIAPMLKHESFKEEKEWRIVSSRLRIFPEINYRANESKIIPYIEISLCQSEEDEVNFKSIYCGPDSNNQLSRMAVMQLLKKNRMPEHTFKLSRTPYKSN